MSDDEIKRAFEAFFAAEKLADVTHNFVALPSPTVVETMQFRKLLAKYKIAWDANSDGLRKVLRQYE